MRTKLKLVPGKKGTKKEVDQYGDRLVCVRYRYDELHERRFKTVELIVEEVKWVPKERRESIAEVRIAWNEKELQSRVRSAGGKWNSRKKVWEIMYERAIELGLKERIVD
jgi:hypothetical protein